MPTSFVPFNPVEIEYRNQVLSVGVDLPRLDVQTQQLEILTFEFTIADPFGITLQFERREASLFLPIPDDIRSVAGIINQVRTTVVDPALTRLRLFVDRVRRELDAAIAEVSQRVDGLVAEVERRVASLVAGVERRVEAVREEVAQSVAGLQETFRGLSDRVDRLVAETVGELQSGLADLRQRIDTTVDGALQTLRDEVTALDNQIDERIQALRAEVLDQIPESFLEDPTQWAFTSAIGYFEAELGNGILRSLKATVDAVLDEALTPETKERLREQRRDQ